MTSTSQFDADAWLYIKGKEHKMTLSTHNTNALNYMSVSNDSG